jgi:hypothetical protein
MNTNLDLVEHTQLIAFVMATTAITNNLNAANQMAS